MKLDDIRDALEARVYEWGEIPVVYENAVLGSAVKNAQQNKQPWAQAVITHSGSEIACIGSNPEVRGRGRLIMSVFTDEKVGSKEAATLADSLIDHLQLWRQGNLRLRTYEMVTEGPDGNGWYQKVVAFPFVAD